MSNLCDWRRLRLQHRRPSNPWEVVIPPAFNARPARFRAHLRHALALGALAVVPLGAQEPAAPSTALDACGPGLISHVFVDNHSIFDLDQLQAGGVLRGVYKLANALHVKTRESFIRRELLFGVGDCLDPFLLEESERLLRQYVFMARVDIFAVPQSDGTQHVVVDTQDEWTTRVDFGPTFDDGIQLETLELSEENVAGLGAQASVFFRQRRERKELGARLNLPRLFGSRTDAAVSAGRTRAGRFLDQGMAYPFVGEVGRLALRQSYHRRDELFPYVVSGEGVDYSHLLLPLLDERAEISVAGRLGRPGSLTLLGVGITHEKLDFGGYPEGLEIARNNDFGNTDTAPTGLADLIRGQVHGAATTRLNVFVGQRNLRFARVRGLESLRGDQDIRLGTDVGLALGRSVGVLSGSQLPHADDLYGRLRLFAAHDPGTSFIFFSGALEGRQVFSRGVNGDGWRDVLGEIDLYGYVRSRKMPGQTFFARVSASGGWAMDTPFQLTMGGRGGIRGLNEEDFPGGRRVLLTFEDRILLNWPAPELFDLGLTLFGDAGRGWAAEVPWGVDSGWKGSVGAGLRLGFPSGTRGVARLDLAFPLGMDSSRGPIFRVTLLEILGVGAGFADAQVGRSRRMRVGPDYFTTDGR
ncbi:MAG TPA: hypothetical protein VLA36_15050 [Longimicrobiales bacterium]|nr:hypothetical protein [Longimicrobiales bacterium]